MKRLSCTFYMLLISIVGCAHVELLGTCYLERYQNKVYLKVVLVKEPFIHALRKNADCEPSKMISECGSALFLDDFVVKINGTTQAWHQRHVEVGQEQVTYLFESSEEIEELFSLKATSTYMHFANSHSTLRVVVGFGDEPTMYTTSVKRPTIYYKGSSNKGDSSN